MRRLFSFAGCDAGATSIEYALMAGTLSLLLVQSAGRVATRIQVTAQTIAGTLAQGKAEIRD